MENTEKVEIGYTVPKERWQEAAKNLEELGNALAAGFLKQNKDGRGKEDADALIRLEWPVTVLVYVSGTGAVQGQFLCPGEVSYRTMQDLEEMSCVPREDLLKYAKGRRLSGWIVQSPEKFDAPSPLAEFGLDRPPMSWQYVEIPEAAEE